MKYQRVVIMLTSFLLAFSVAAYAAESPLFEDVHVVSLPKGKFGYRGMPGTIAALNDGRLLLAYTRMLPSGSGDGSIAAKYSSDNGKTWGEEFVLVPDPVPAGQDYYCHPSLLRLQNGQIFLSYIYGSGAPMPNMFGGNYYRRSADDGKTWGDQLIVTAHPGYNIVHNDKFIQLSSGRILAPVEFHLDHSRGDHAGYVSYTVYSDDNGYSWRESTNMVNMQPIETQEPHVVELKDGRIMMLMRTYNGFVVRSYSSDKGESWSEGEKVEALTLAPNSSALNIKRIPKTGDLVLLRCSNGTDGRRTPLVSILSKDDGATWTNERVIGGDPEDDYGYPGLTFVDDVAIIVYHMRDGLHVARIGTDWFYAE
ncbi:MAG: glycoside hydrolase [Candidatus Hydrogenedentes bacterium]|nr:glycoside hydrolase [Candidatus Hydrogenedentota bacterium]